MYYCLSPREISPSSSFLFAYKAVIPDLNTVARYWTLDPPRSPDRSPSLNRYMGPNRPKVLSHLSDGFFFFWLIVRCMPYPHTSIIIVSLWIKSDAVTARSITESFFSSYTEYKKFRIFPVSHVFLLYLYSKTNFEVHIIKIRLESVNINLLSPKNLSSVCCPLRLFQLSMIIFPITLNRTYYTKIYKYKIEK